VYENNFIEEIKPLDSIKIYGIEPDFDDLVDELGQIPHILKDQYGYNHLCCKPINQLKFNESSSKAVFLIQLTEKWLYLFENWLDGQIELDDFKIGL
jgi:hypothetical protein